MKKTYIIDNEFAFWRTLEGAVQRFVDALPDKSVLDIRNTEADGKHSAGYVIEMVRTADGNEALNMRLAGRPESMFCIERLSELTGGSDLAGSDGTLVSIRDNTGVLDHLTRRDTAFAMDTDGAVKEYVVLDDSLVLDGILRRIESEENLRAVGIDPSGLEDAADKEHAILAYERQGGYVIEGFTAHSYTMKELEGWFRENAPEMVDRYSWLDTVHVSNAISCAGFVFTDYDMSWKDVLCGGIRDRILDKDARRESEQFRLSFLPGGVRDRVLTESRSLERKVFDVFGLRPDRDRGREMKVAFSEGKKSGYGDDIGVYMLEDRLEVRLGSVYRAPFSVVSVEYPRLAEYARRMVLQAVRNEKVRKIYQRFTNAVGVKRSNGIGR